MAYCVPCDREFVHWEAYRQHTINSSGHPYCSSCDRDFDSWYAFKQHWIQSPRHSFCRGCDRHFGDNDELVQHCLDEHDYCQRCDRFFRNARGLHEHNRQSHHYCVECRLVFNSENNLRMHMRSRLHCPENVPCPFPGCAQSFISKSAMISHLESGVCSSGVDRDTVNQHIRLIDRNNAITIPQHLLTYGDTPSRYIATERSWNGDAYECVLCHRAFRTLVDLNRHLASPRHQEKIYRCPLSTCLMKFTTLSALCQHVESESCGVLRFRDVRDGMDRLLGNMRRLRIEG